MYVLMHGHLYIWTELLQKSAHLRPKFGPQLGISPDISLIIEGCPDTLIMRFTAKPYILWKILFHWICSKFYEFKHGHNFFWPQRSWRLLEAKNTPRRPKLSWRSWFFEKSIKWKFLSNLINPLADPIRFDLRPQVKKIQPPRSLDVHSY